MKSKISAILIFLTLVFTTPVSAGGQLTSLNADSQGSISSDGTYSRTMRVVTQVRPCEGTVLTFKFVDPKEGDYVVTQSGNATFTFTKDRKPYYKNGEQVCGTTAKIGSKVSGEREVTVIVQDTNGVSIDVPPVIKVHFDGQYHGDNHSNGYSYSSSQDDLSYLMTHPQATTDTNSSNTGSFYAKVGVQKYLGGPKRSVYISWNKSQNAVKYNIYARLSDTKDYGAALVGTGGLGSEININAFLNYYVKVDACAAADSCISSPEVYIAAMKQDGKNEANVVSQPKEPKVQPSVVDTNPQTVAVKDSSEAAKLENKVADLEKKLEESQKRQSALEQTLNNLTKWIKSVFPFFK